MDAQTENRFEVDSEEAYPELEDKNTLNPEQRMQSEEIVLTNVQIRDEKLLLLVCDRLKHHPRLNALNMEVSILHGSITISGEAHAASEKLLVTEIVAALPGVTEIHNALKVA